MGSEVRGLESTVVSVWVLVASIATITRTRSPLCGGSRLRLPRRVDAGLHCLGHVKRRTTTPTCLIAELVSESLAAFVLVCGPCLSLF